MKARQLVLLALLALCPTLARAQCVSLTTGGVPYGQDFDSLASAGDSSVTPAGWFFLETGANANGTYSYTLNNAAANGYRPFAEWTPARLELTQQVNV